jgi:hypothetical protein
MSSILDNYGAADARRERVVRNVLIAVVSVAVIGGLLWFFFRDFREEARVREFLSLLERKDFPSAYAMWGCSQAKPCRDYSFEKFLQDWGPASDAAAGVQRAKVKSCNSGIIQVLRIKGQDVNLYVNRATQELSYSPWPVCNPRIKL